MSDPTVMMATPGMVGRPRDPDVDRRILDATIQIFAAAGWPGLTMERVASTARTGKTSLYMRWATRHDLLKAALLWFLAEHAPAIDPDMSVRDHLVAVVRARAEMLLGPHGIAVLRYEVDSRALPEEFADIRQEVSTAEVLRMRHWLEGEIARGSAMTTRSAMQVLEALEGSVLAHVMVTPPELIPRVIAALPEWSEQLVDSQLGFAHRDPILGVHR